MASRYTDQARPPVADVRRLRECCLMKRLRPGMLVIITAGLNKNRVVKFAGHPLQLTARHDREHRIMADITDAGGCKGVLPLLKLRLPVVPKLAALRHKYIDHHCLG